MRFSFSFGPVEGSGSAWFWRWCLLRLLASLASIMFTKEEVSFVALNEGVILVKFGKIDRTRILNLNPWLFDQSLFAMLPFVKGQELDDFVLNIMPFWIRIYNIPFEKMDRKVAIDVGKAIG
ncbi:hypothetical protein Golob_017939, partial [Gossypium lobatum]|nr:hypothetical protein [Gossypium lobatum]